MERALIQLSQVPARNPRAFYVFSSPCGECLLSPQRVVSPKRAAQLIRECREKQTHFICHKASLEKRDVACAAWVEHRGHESQVLRIARRLNLVVLVEQPFPAPSSPSAPTSKEVR